MFIKFYKIIHSKYSRFYAFVFFLRYLLIIFFISSVIFISIPTLFNYDKKAANIKIYFLENYNFKIKNYEKIKYNIFPLPNLDLTNVQIDLESIAEDLTVKRIKVYPDFLSMYNYENFNSKKIILKESDVKFQISNFKRLTNQLFNKKKNINFDNLNFEIINENTPLIVINNIKFANYGYNENLIIGKVFNKNFQINLDNNYRNINFELLNSGIRAYIDLNENQKESLKFGTFKSKILNSHFKTNFEYDGKVVKIFKSYFRSKNLSFKNESEIILNPFLDVNSKFIIEEFDAQILKKINLNKFLKSKEFLKKINNKSEINFKSKKFNKKFIDDFNLEIDLAYGKMNYSKKISNTTYVIKCFGSVNFLEEYPLLFFDCFIKLDDKQKFLKKLSIKDKNKNEVFDLKVKGNLNILNRKINFKNISLNDSYKASKEDLKYFKDIFEKILFDKNFLEIFNFKKIREFIIEIS